MYILLQFTNKNNTTKYLLQNVKNKNKIIEIVVFTVINLSNGIMNSLKKVAKARNMILNIKMTIIELSTTVKF